LAEVATRTGLVLNPKVLTLGFARRVATYKRATLLFTDPERLVEIATAAGGLQILYAGKAHPQDEPGKALIQQVVEDAAKFSNDTCCASSISKTTHGISARCSRRASMCG
jgi:starch phosphorylase